MVEGESTRPISLSFTHSTTLSQFEESPPVYLASHPRLQCEYLATGSFVFDTSDLSEPKLLLLQRAATDSMPNRWEAPGGGCDDDDTSILYSAARELWEETGLKAQHITSLVGSPRHFSSSSGKRICKFEFLVEIESTKGEHHVILDPKEHQQYIWASEDNIKRRKVDNNELSLTHDELAHTIAEAFQHLRTITKA